MIWGGQVSMKTMIIILSKLGSLVQLCYVSSKYILSIDVFLYLYFIKISIRIKHEEHLHYMNKNLLHKTQSKKDILQTNM